MAGPDDPAAVPDAETAGSTGIAPGGTRTAAGSAGDTPGGDPEAVSSPVQAALAGAEAELERLGRELAEIAMLEQQTRGEAARHEQRRAQAADRLAALQARGDGDPDELREAVTQVITLTRRAALMESQVDVLAGKQKTLVRYRDHLAELVGALRAAAEWAPPAEAGPDAELPVPAPVSRAILSAQEDLRRDIARAMHDGPAQSLANIVLQAQIVERLVSRDPEAALGEARALIDVVQHALDATKTFIFDVRPMVLDDLGLVPTLRRLARDRGHAAQVPVTFESVGADRRLDLDLETGLFRILDQATVAYLATEPSRVELSLTWEDTSLAAQVRAVHTAETVLALPAETPPDAAADGPTTDGAERKTPAAGDEPTKPRGRAGRFHLLGSREQGEDLPPALAAMIREQREGEAARATASTAAPDAPQGLPATAWRDIAQRARSLGIEARLSDEGRCLDLAVNLPA